MTSPLETSMFPKFASDITPSISWASLVRHLAVPRPAVDGRLEAEILSQGASCLRDRIWTALWARIVPLQNLGLGRVERRSIIKVLYNWQSRAGCRGGQENSEKGKEGHEYTF